MDNKQKYGLFIGGFLLFSAAAALLMYAADPDADKPAPAHSTAARASSAEERVPEAEPLPNAVEVDIHRENCKRAVFSGDRPAALSVAEIGDLPACAVSETVTVSAEDGGAVKGTLRFEFSRYFGAPNGKDVLLLRMEQRGGSSVFCPFADAAGQDGKNTVLDFSDVGEGTYLLVSRAGWLRDNPDGEEQGRVLADPVLGFSVQLLPGVRFTENEINTDDASYNLEGMGFDEMENPDSPAFVVPHTGEIHVQLITPDRAHLPAGLTDVRAEWVEYIDMVTASEYYLAQAEEDAAKEILDSREETADTGERIVLIRMLDSDSGTEEIAAFFPLEKYQYILMKYRCGAGYGEQFAESVLKSCRSYRLTARKEEQE